MMGSYVEGGVSSLDSSWNSIPWTVIWIWCYNGYNVAPDINLGINTIISRLLTYALLPTNKAIYPFTKRDEEVFLPKNKE